MTARGFSMVELLVVTVVLGVLALILGSVAVEQIGRVAIRNAHSELLTLFRELQTRALMEERHAGVRFRVVGGRWTYALYIDGDGDGLRNSDIASGTDPLVRGPVRLSGGFGNVRFGLPAHLLKDPVSNKAMTANASPVRFNESSLCSFSPESESTPGSLIITNGKETRAVVLSGQNGGIRSLRWDRQGFRWVVEQ